MAIPYEQQNDITKRKEVTPKPKIPETSKKAVDNSNSILYNKNNNTLFGKDYVPGSLTAGWSQKNKDSLKYAGDNAKKSIHAGLEDAPSFMKDADEGTRFEDVQTASVKWKLANDSNNSDLAKKASMELIGHLSKENKEPYLKHTLPLQTYIDAKDEFDYKHKNYTTTEFINTTPDENVRQQQQKLNELGYTDKFGEKLKEDGIEGAKTRYAKDKYEAVNGNNLTTVSGNTDYGVATLNYSDESTSQRYRNRVSLPVRTGTRPGSREAYQNRPVVENNKSSNTYTNNSGVIKWKEIPDIVQRLPKETNLYRQKKISKEIYDAMDKISQRWYYADTDKARDEISDLANKIRNSNYMIDDCSNEANEQLYHNGNVIKAFRFVGTAPPLGFKQLFHTLACYAATGLAWYVLVDNDGKWDYKVQVDENDWIPKNRVFWYHDQIISVADFGNLNFGYTGTILGLSPETLYKGGGKVNPNPTQYEIDNYYGDTEVDHYWVKKGIELANKQGYTGDLELDVDMIFEMKGMLGI